MSGIEALLFSTHAILAAGLKVPEIALSKTEAETLAKATADVAKHYPTSISPKTIAWCNLATCVGLTYGPRVYMVRSRLDKEKRERKGAPEPTPAANEAAAFIPPGFAGGIGPTPDATTM